MSNSGRLDDATPSAPWSVIGCGVFGLGLFAWLGWILFPVIAALLFPPLPPIPSEVDQQGHVSRGYGTDEWVYQTQADECELVTFFEDAGGTCEVSPGFCGIDARPRSALVAECNGIVPFNRFRMRWESVIQAYPSHRQLDVSRDIAWLR